MYPFLRLGLRPDAGYHQERQNKPLAHSVRSVCAMSFKIKLKLASNSSPADFSGEPLLDCLSSDYGFGVALKICACQVAVGTLHIEPGQCVAATSGK